MEEALICSGENRPELEKVLLYYQKQKTEEGKLKYKAACFLIENMSAHYSYADTALIHPYYDQIEDMYENLKGKSREEIDYAYYLLSHKHKQDTFRYISDIKNIQADYLINNIEQSFNLWKNSTWATHIDFEDFCEYILPYKVYELQTLDNWRDYLKEAYNGDLNNLQYRGQWDNSSFQACSMVASSMREEIKPLISFGHYTLPVLRMSSLAKKHAGSCGDYSVLALAVMRSKGIPVAIDFVPQWPFRSLGHVWNVLKDDTGKNIVFDASSSDPGKTHIDFPIGKVFRHCYAVNREIEQFRKAVRHIPPVFSNICIKDVSDEYMTVDDVRVSLNTAPDNSRYAYLAVFNNIEWIPVQYGKISGRKAWFKKMGRGVVYLPVYWGKEGLTAAGDPFILNRLGEMKILKPDASKKQTIVARRKYPVSSDAVWAAGRMLNGRIEAANREDFNDRITVYTVKEHPVCSGEIILDTLNKKYRYWRYYGDWDTHCNIAELYFFPANGNACNTGKIMGTAGSYDNNPRTTIEAAFDGDPLTFFDAQIPSEAWVGMDFGEPVAMKRINFAPRSDGNCVIIGNEYELFYFEKNQWNSLGRKKADNVHIDYDNCPQNALFLLHNHTAGVQERIFTYENGEQVWW
jgi:hypothetical protein